MSFTRWPMLCCLQLMVAVASSQSDISVNALEMINPDNHALLGDWEFGKSGLRVKSPRERALCVVPYELSGDYKLSFDFTRLEGDDVVGVILPLQKTQVLFELSGWGGEAHGLSRINGASTRSAANPASVRPGSLETGVRHSASVEVTFGDLQLTVDATLDNNSLFRWSGSIDDVAPNLVHQTPNKQRPALVTSKSTAVFHSLRIEHAPTKGRTVSIDLSQAPGRESSAEPIVNLEAEPVTAGKLDLTVVNWGQRRGNLSLVDFKGEKVVQLQGTDDRCVALLPGVDFSNGEIEVEIASDIFSGIAFRASDTDNYELLYFRPQNSGTAKHQNTIQYVSKGTKGADWRNLRANFPGEYEAGADLPVNDWFRARLLIQGQRLAVFVNDSDEPSLVVDELLGERPSGTIGIWGWNTRFRGFAFTPEAD